MKTKILIHSCCAPCTTATLEKIRNDNNADIEVFYYNPNISPAEEEEKRFSELSLYLEKRYGNEVKLIRGEYDAHRWNSLVTPIELSGEGGFRCKVCYYIRLLETFNKAVETGADLVTTTLSISPYKNYEWLDEIGRLLSKKTGIGWFLEKWDYKRSVEISKEYGLYRQNYCGCEFSRVERLNLSKRQGS
ncbi:MAG TPA: epoxyqueuosine reductase QueH [bacterium]|nr:epoxyqueuosine reductase QueH [bacterium]HPS29259.1 epoxyqueuosine reductase QueH [bacterium]